MARYEKGSSENNLNTKVIKALADELNLSQAQARRHYAGETHFSKSKIGKKIINSIKSKHEREETAS